MAAMRNVSSTPLSCRTKNTSNRKPTAIRMYCRYVETTSFLVGTPVSDRGLYAPNIPARSTAAASLQPAGSSV
jgi:hypothetical protein